MAGGNVDSSDRLTYFHKVSEFYGALNDYAESLVDPLWDINGSRIAEMVVLQAMYLQWASE